MNQDNARYLWNQLMGKHVGGENELEFNASPLASVAVSHDLPMEIDDSQKGPGVRDREAVAAWLRKWADGIEGIG